MGLEVERQAELADAVPDDPDTDLAVAERLPLPGSVVVGLGLIEAGDLLGCLGESQQRIPRGGSRRRGGKERTARYVRHGRGLLG